VFFRLLAVANEAKAALDATGMDYTPQLQSLINWLEGTDPGEVETAGPVTICPVCRDPLEPSEDHLYAPFHISCFWGY